MNPTTPRQLRRLIYQMIDAYAGTGDATDHGTLTGLSDDDHNQYAKKASNLSDLTSASTARTNLGLGSLATASNINGSNWSGTDLAVTDGGTGASDAPGARTNLGLVIGTDVQAYNANLTTWAGKTAPTGTVVGTSDTQTLTGKTIDADNNTISNIALGAEATGAVNDLSDVTITTPADNEVLAYDNGTSTWINQTPAEAGISATGHSHTESDISDLSHTVDVVSNVASSRILGRTTAGSGNSEELTASQVRTLLNVEDGADVTDTANVTSAGALMDSELTDLAGVKALNTSTLQLKPSEGAFANGDKTKLDGIETAADVTDATNVDAAGAVMNSDTSTASMSFVVDEDNMASDSATKVPTQQSVKAYADTKAAGSHTHTESDVTDLDHDAVKIRGVGVDSTVGTPSDGKILVYRSAGSDWVLEDKPAGGSNPAINDITDVTISSVSDNEVLAYDNGSSTWINQTAAEAGLSATGHTHTESDVSDLGSYITASSSDTLTNKTIDGDDNTLQDIPSTALKEAFFRGRQQSNTTNTSETGMLYQWGWGFVAGTGTTFAGETVTFPTAFSGTPYVLVSAAGFKSGSDPTSQGDTGGPVGGSASTDNPTTTTVDIRYTQGGNFSSSVRILYIWYAIGPA